MKTTRRAALRCTAVMAAAALLVTACGDDDDDTSNPATDTTEGSEDSAQGDPEVVRLGYDLVSAARGGFSFDPEVTASTVADVGLQQWIYGTLMRPGPDGELVPELAESAEAVDADTIEIELRDGIEMSDGTPVDADLVKAVLDDNLSKPDVGTFNDAFYNLTSVEVTSPTSLTLAIDGGTAASWRDRFLSSVETMLVPPDTDYEEPVGAGPYVLESFEPEQEMVLTKSPTYWDPDSIAIDRLELVHTAADQSSSAAVSAGQVDWVYLFTPEQVQAVSGDVEIYSEPDPYALTSILTCKSEPPLDDPQVRRALAYALDRDAINDAQLGGEGLPAWGLWPEGHPFHNDDWTEHYAHDPEQAEQLLADAGYPDGFSVDLVGFPGMENVLQVMQQQWAEVGVEMNIVASTNFVEDAFLSRKGQMVAIPVLPREGGRTGHWSGGGVSNLCGYSDPELDALVDEFTTVSQSSDEAVEIMHQISDIVIEDALSIFVLYQPRWVAHVPELENVAPMPYTVVVPDVWQLEVAD